ncbi:hypothetical protein MPTK1_1g28770 [Marchantia polymorpha subsp. ruderalis]|uniref:Uncharacterized protein n=2 Tax=Marchantia polymorpha TaxID=3197 RepID=A0A176VX23_MARPO|nr:hypothetical protein AXG93_522s1070 [Marchantia polymorpha subsp. ruderalis]PTQ49488.1 hypothetical protein MARPO_0002s0003 [Marchantia polymorpha]BBN00395.1 hypothetical protein Mp_1g28770 [Marchantia polymorpha subsp. ruderalis]|eukprot:PTQ49488.1 hypothetical protein MARPO_0002s0003 [Marchantia polymorpha]
MKSLASPSASTSPVAANRQKQMLFDRRYGWVYEQWTDPIEVANMGGRGMFSLVPLTASTLDGTIYMANRAADGIVQAVQNREVILQQLQSKVKECGEFTGRQMKGLGEKTRHQWKALGEKASGSKSSR